MRQISIEQLLFLVLFVLVPLVNLLVRWLRARAAERPPRERTGDEGPDLATPRREIPGREVPGRRGPRRDARPRVPLAPRTVTPLPEPMPATRTGMPAVAPPLAPTTARGPRRPRIRLAGQREIRRTVVLMTVLGPCRGLEPTTGRAASLDR